MKNKALGKKFDIEKVKGDALMREIHKTEHLHQTIKEAIEFLEEELIARKMLEEEDYSLKPITLLIKKLKVSIGEEE